MSRIKKPWFCLTVVLALLAFFIPLPAKGIDCSQPGIAKTFDLAPGMGFYEVAVLIRSQGICNTSFTHASLAFQVEPPEAQITVTPQGWGGNPDIARFWPGGWHNPALGRYVYYVGEAQSRAIESDRDDQQPWAYILAIKGDVPITVTIVDVSEAGIWNSYFSYDHWIVREEISSASEPEFGACVESDDSCYQSKAWWLCEFYGGEWIGVNTECPDAEPEILIELQTTGIEPGVLPEHRLLETTKQKSP